MAGPMAEQMAGPMAEQMAGPMAEQMAAERVAGVFIGLLEHQFGNPGLPAETVARVKQAGIEDLEVWAGRMPGASTLEAVFNGGGNGKGNGASP